MRTQWRSGFGGPTGLDYVALLAMMDFHAVAHADRRDMLDDVQVLEHAALEEIAVKYT